MAAAAHAGEVMDTQVTNDGGHYAVRFDVRLAASPERIKRYLTDYAHYADYFSSVRESQVLTHEPDGAMRVRLVFYSCVIFFCRDVTFVKDISETPDGAIVARIVPAQSDFSEATEQWRISPDDGQTRLQYRAALVPTFFVPPVIGPWLLKLKIRDSLESGADKLEALARGDAASSRKRSEPIGDNPMGTR
jgi:hypothetical protein